jgi:hypothetical protein
MVQPTALNFIIVGLMTIIFLFMWRYVSASIVDRNPESQFGRGMAAIID